jgi:threonylcarbamoyladenosine tRNA methylthiotransferase MtaB
MHLRVAFHTLGCKLNQLETESLADAFRRSGASILGRSENPVTAPADLFVINTCTVTSKAEQKARRLVRQALAANPAALVLVTGCYAQVEPGALSGLHERALVIPGDEKSALLSLAAWLADEWQGHGDLLDAVISWKRGLAGPVTPDAFAFLPDEFAFHSRPSLKVQDGCDNRCSYCRVCIARGASRSLPAPEILRRLTALEAAGRAEAILTGVNLFQYRDEGLRFPDLLRLLIEGTERIALRLSSWEPEGLDASFLDILAHPRIRPHIHLPVQSGSDLLLGRMARAYRRDQVIEACAALRAAKGDLFIAADLIAGFPGEEEADFEATLDLARACDFAWIHAFPFSPRPGTRAFGMGPHVPERISGERVRLLGELARLGRASYIGRQGGREVEAVLEASPRGGEEGFRHATSDNYLKLLIGAVPAHIPGGSAFRCRIGFAAGRKGDPRLGDADAQASFISP